MSRKRRNQLESFLICEWCLKCVKKWSQDNFLRYVLGSHFLVSMHCIQGMQVHFPSSQSIFTASVNSSSCKNLWICGFVKFGQIWRYASRKQSKIYIRRLKEQLVQKATSPGGAPTGPVAVKKLIRQIRVGVNISCYGGPILTTLVTKHGFTWDANPSKIHPIRGQQLQKSHKNLI